jgi:Etoposide-induced protein 2.4 (EI24)
MKPLLDAFWRAAAYCLHPQVIALSILPVLLSSALMLGLGYFFWDGAVAAVRSTLESFSLVDAALRWVEDMVGMKLRVALAPLLLLALALPLMVMLTVLLVAALATPAVVRLVAARRFASLERKRGGGLVGSVFRSAGYTLAAVAALLLTMPLWLIPPLVLVLPPLIWGWLTTQVFSYDTLSEHASKDERRQLLQEHRWPLLAIGVLAGYLGAAPSLLLFASVATLVFSPLLAPLLMWLYTLVFIFCAAWFAHYGLAALDRLRRTASEVVPAAGAGASAPRAVPAPAPALPPGATGPAPATDLLPPA